MKDLGIRAPLVDAVRRFIARAPKHSLIPLAQTVSEAADAQGGMNETVADACDLLYSRIVELDTDGDGVIESHESSAHEELDEVLQALRENDRDGDGSHAATPVASKPTADQPRVREAFGFDVPRRALVLTLWSSRGARWAFERSRARIEAIKPDGVLLHTDPVALANGGGAQLTADVRAAFPSLKVGWAIYGDSYGPDPSTVWDRCARAASAAGVETLMLNCERAWKSARRGSLEMREGIAKRAVRAVRDAAPGLHVSFTSYDGPCSIVTSTKERWGGHGAFPWKGFLGDGVVHANCPQVYLAGADRGPGATYSAALSREQRSWASHVEAVRRGWIKTGVDHWLYLQAHSSQSAAIGYLGTQARVTCAWASPTRVDMQGVEGLKALSALNRGRHRSVTAFQKEVGLVADGQMGSETVKRLLT